MQTTHARMNAQRVLFLQGVTLLWMIEERLLRERNERCFVSNVSNALTCNGWTDENSLGEFVDKQFLVQ